MSARTGLLRRALIVLAALAALAGVIGAGTGEVQAQETLPAIDLGGLDTRSAALMLSAQEAGDLEVSALAIPLPDPAGSGDSRVVLVVDLEGKSLLDAAEAAPPAGVSPLIVEVYAYALDGEGGLIDSLTQAFRLDPEAHRPLLSTGGGIDFFGIKFLGDLDLPPGKYSLRVLVLQRRSSRLGLRILPLAVPSWGSDPMLLPPLRRESPKGWILVHAAGTTPPVVTIRGESWVPSARRGLDAGATAGYLLLGRGLERGLRAHLLDGSREVVAEVGLGDLRRATGGPPGVEVLAAEVATATLDAGEYRLRVSATGGPAVADSAPLVVRPAGDEQPEPVGSPAGLSARSSRGRRAAFERLEEVRGGYLEAFERLASGDRARALEPLIEIERSRIGKGSVVEQKRLARAELEVARQLAGVDAERLLVVIRLHEALYRRHHRQQRYLLATHSRLMVRLMAELYLERARAPRARHLVACALVSLGGYLQETGSRVAAAKAYHDALAHDPEHPAALLGLAAIQEFYGQYQAAADLLQRLHKLRPDETQARLRLGINLRRLDKTRRAASHLGAAISEPGPDWVATVAAQELASLHAGEKRLGEALGVLEEAVARHPENQRLRVQLAALLDRAGRRTEALAVLGRLDPSAGRDAGSPRLIYSRTPTAAITAARRALAEETERRLAARGATD